MKLVRGAWKILVGIKDALVLAAMLLFFGLLFAGLNAGPRPASIRDGALVLDLNGQIVEQPSENDPFAALGGNAPVREFRLRDLVRLLDKARTDDRVKVVVLDLDTFAGGYPAALTEVADAIRAVRDGVGGKGGKPVLAYATAYTDSGYRLASAASEIWMNPMGGTLFSGPGGSQLYYKGLIDKLGVNAHIYRVGKYKSFVEPYTRADQSPEAKEAATALQGVIFQQWKDQIAKARPKAKIAPMLTTPDAVITAAGGDIARANLQSGIVDKLAERIEFDKRVGQIAGTDAKKAAGNFNTIKYDTYLAANPLPKGGDAIGVLTVAGEIVDGKAKAGTAGGDTIAKAMLDGLSKNKLKALVVRVDSPGGSALASEKIRRAIFEAKQQGLPVVVSMGSVAASGGYWVSTAGDMIFAEPTTITGSIGIFGIIPTFENTLAKIGVTSDGVKSTPLSGQPDVIAGTNAETDRLLQSAIDHGYAQFIDRVSKARKMTPARVDEIAQGRVWDGGTARQIGLVDRFGGLNDAIAEAARRAKLDPAKIQAVYLERQPGWLARFAAQFAGSGDDDDTAGGDVFARISADHKAVLARALGDMRRLTRASSIQARCLECGGLGPVTAPEQGDLTLLDMLLAKFAK
ncbi:signal peptide peptidase SppA [Sphingomonas sp. Leaf357]|uniref:signal peptide peptidase SppA n=1 Tax=Sphingomonas sp. Leaf357 TaxID=1736350 RepID=UPI0006F98ED4|nr:signal peptide peptidase SppA [Sphingomonas sp. Leaf357]KQS02911.1 signal peptide peptidase SppA [Sphingomonas sp. Leaf357]